MHRAQIVVLAVVVGSVGIAAAPVYAQQEPDGCTYFYWGASSTFSGRSFSEWHVRNECNARIHFLWRDNENGADIDRVIRRNGDPVDYDKGLFLDPGRDATRTLITPMGVRADITYCVQWALSSERRRRNAGYCQ